MSCTIQECMMLLANDRLRIAAFEKGVELFDEARFFEAHEVLEDVWRSLPLNSPVRLHLQGMVQLAVAFHHVSTGNYIGAGSVLERAISHVASAGDSFPGLDLNRLRTELEPWQQFLIYSSDAGAAPASGTTILKNDESDLGGCNVISLRKAPALPKIANRRV